MPCNCDYLEPNSTEVEMSKVACLLDEFAGKPINRSHWNGMHPRIYNQTYDRYAGDFDEPKMVRELVSKIKACDVTQHSLEMQMWWRDYQAKYMECEAEAEKKRAIQKKRDAALSKLTDADREVLGL